MAARPFRGGTYKALARNARAPREQKRHAPRPECKAPPPGGGSGAWKTRGGGRVRTRIFCLRGADAYLNCVRPLVSEALIGSTEAVATFWARSESSLAWATIASYCLRACSVWSCTASDTEVTEDMA